MKGETDVDKGGNSLDRPTMLGMVDEIALATLVSGVPFEYLKLGVIGALRRRARRDGFSGVCEVGMLERFLC